MKKHFTVIFLILSGALFSQYIKNPSFEGPPGEAKIPDGWSACEKYSTPDTQPGAYKCRNGARDGSTYISLVGRTTPASSAGYTEDIETLLLKPLKKGACYILRMDLAYSTAFAFDDFGEFYSFNNPMKLAVFGSSTSCSKQQTLGISPVVTADTWKTFEIKIEPLEDIKYLRLHSQFVDINRFCNILVDNLQLTEAVSETSVTKDTLVHLNDRIKLDAGEGLSYSWNPTSGISCSTCRDPEITANGTSYTVSILDGKNCEFHQKIFKIGLLKKENIFIPNVITPNADGFNDKFVIRPLPLNCELTIMNRLGEVLYKTNNYDNSWGGMFDGELLKSDTYWYVFRFDKDEQPIRGFVYLKQTE